MSVEYFENLLNSTSTRLEKSCNEWQTFLDGASNVPEDAASEIMSALGEF